ncbi:MAG: NADH-quinone oxidoreductase subunit C [Gemmatimonadetes bacterium]|nr:NADH-quinone oxidoreductase subunit C [Gemmatimonadota bacterium]NNM06027.1 NADH-quinone oxidoreductase subunit C [Gemmatimonadota bacterium]
MADEKSSFDAVVAGPKPSSEAVADPVSVGPPSKVHPSVSALRDRFGEAVLRHEVVANDQHLVFIPPERNLEILTWLRDDTEQQYDLLRDVTAVDYGGGRPLQVVYQLFSFFHKQALRVKCELPLDALEIESVCSLWMAANWLEREVYDLFGINFKNHPDLRRILMPPDYAEGHPLRKDFPLRGRFSRAEQTRRALSQDLEHYYFESELERGGESQALPSVEEMASLPPTEGQQALPPAEGDGE